MSSEWSVGIKIKKHKLLSLKRIVLIGLVALGGLFIAHSAHADPIILKLSGEMQAAGDVGSFIISPDESRVVYVADQQTDEVAELYSVPIGGGTATKLNGIMVGGGDVTSF